MGMKYIVDAESAEALQLTVDEEAQAIVDGTKFTARQAARANESARVSAIAGDAETVDLVNRLKTDTASQIQSHINSNVTDLASTKILLTKMALVLALLARGL